MTMLYNLLAAIVVALLKFLMARRDLVERGRAEEIADESANWVAAMAWEQGAAARPDGGVGTVRVRDDRQGLTLPSGDSGAPGAAEDDTLP